ncbi:MAG: class I SAM-dependent methyltransferase [Dehalococcoidia bacterium]
MPQPSAEAAMLGEPSYVWRSGQDRRLALIREYVPLEGQRILDIGCGIGTYVRRLRELSPNVNGVDISVKRLQQGAATIPGLVAAVGEHLPFRDDYFDVIILNEVIEHVNNDRSTLRESLRVISPGGHIVIYAPNRLYPFETHGIYLGKRYVFGNIPLVNYLPDRLRHRLVPHARAYRDGDLQKLIGGLAARVVVHGYVYPGFDNVAARNALAAKVLRGLLYRAEHTSVRHFGLSHFLILRKR